MALERDNILFPRTNQRVWCSECVCVVVPNDGDFRMVELKLRRKQSDKLQRIKGARVCCV